MEWITVIGLILFGIGLIVVEIIFIPGTTVVGIFGIICGGIGVFLGYDYFGNSIGHVILAISAILSGAVTLYAFRSNAWDRFSLKEQNTGKFNDEFKLNLSIGDQGTTISSLKPVGKALFDQKEVEVRSNGGFITENQVIEIMKIEPNKIIVKTI